MTSVTGTPLSTTSTVALKEWGAVVHALLDGRQSVLLRKGGIAEKAFDVAGDRFVLFPTVAHSHADRVRPEHRDVLAAGAADVDEGRSTITVRCGVSLVDVVAVARTEALPALADFHIWTDASVRADRVDFRPKHALQVLIVRAFELPEPVVLPRLDAYAGCRSWVDLPVAWSGRDGRQVLPDERLAAVAQRVHATVGPARP